MRAAELRLARAMLARGHGLQVAAWTLDVSMAVLRACLELAAELDTGPENSREEMDPETNGQGDKRPAPAAPARRHTTIDEARARAGRKSPGGGSRERGAALDAALAAFEAGGGKVTRLEPGRAKGALDWQENQTLIGSMR